jgi:phosphoribosylaminoimidazolecarboxamide formyltransferase/IMP cyclohydrolase
MLVVLLQETISDAYNVALACDPTSAFGGVLIANTKIDVATATEINKLFCEVVIAPEYDANLKFYNKRKTELF